MEKCSLFLNDHLKKYPNSDLLNIIYKYNICIDLNGYISKLKNAFNLIFKDSIEKQVFLRLPADDLHALLTSRALHSTDEYYFVRGIVLYIQNDIHDRIDEAERLFSTIDVKLCNKRLMLHYRNIATGNSTLDDILTGLHSNIEPNENCGLKLLHLATYAITEDGVYNLVDGQRVIEYKFASCTTYIYTLHYLFAINFDNSSMVRIDTLTNEVYECSYPDKYGMQPYYYPSVNEMQDGNLIVIGGRMHIGYMWTRDVKYYNVLNDQWTSGPQLPRYLYNQATVVVGGDVYVTGGMNPRYKYTRYEARKTHTVLRLHNGYWSYTSDLLRSIRGHSMTQDSGRIYVLGERPQCYDIESTVWSDFHTYKFDKSVIYYNYYDGRNALYGLCADGMYSVSLRDKTTTRVHKYDSTTFDKVRRSLVLMDLGTLYV